MKKMMKLVVAVLCAIPVVSLAADAVLETVMNEDRAPIGSEVELGVWNADIDACIDLAEKTGIPMIGVWSREGCAHCQIFERAMTSNVFREWVKTSGLILGFSCSLDPDGGVRQGTAVEKASSTGAKRYTGNGRYWKWCKGPENLSNYPEVRFYWYKDGKKIVDFAVLGDTVDGQQGIYMGSYDKAGQKVIDYITNKSGFADYLANPKTLTKYAGGTFALEETDGNRLETEGNLDTVKVTLVRNEEVASVVTSNVIRVVAPDGTLLRSQTVSWASNETQKAEYEIDISGATFTEDGEKVLLIATDLEGAEQSTNTVTYITENSVSNPLWIGERAAYEATPSPSTATRRLMLPEETPVLGWGEWTMDLDVAKAKVAKAVEDGQKAYTLVAVIGALWCHDCANTERNFVNAVDDKGNNKFKAWAEANNVAFVAIDVPQFTNSNIRATSKPCLLSKQAFSSTLAYELEAYGMYDVSKGGADESLTVAQMRSGLGYMTRKGISDEEADAKLEEFRKLITTDVSEGGFHSTADSNAYRTGVPIYILLDSTGTPVARMTRFASVSPYTDIKWDNVIKRFDEMLAIADNTDGHKDGGVLENDFPAETLPGLVADGGNTSGEISHVDIRDIFKLEGFAGNALIKVDVKGEETDTASVTVSFVTLDEEGKKTTIATTSGTLAEGFSLEYEFTDAGTYYVEISGDYNGDFSVEADAENNFHSFTINSSRVIVPQEQRTHAAAAEGTSSITVRLVAGQMYRFEGLLTTGENVKASLTSTRPDVINNTFFVSKTTGDVSLETFFTGGTLTYQKWVASEIGFVEETGEAKESDESYTLEIERANGKSGAVTVKVSLDEEATTHYDSDGTARFVFDEQQITWAENENTNKFITITLKDDVRYDGDGVVALKLEKVSDENGDTVISTSSFALTVRENDKQSAGKVAFTGSDPAFSKKLTTYARVGDKVTVFLSRIDASDGAVSVKVSGSRCTLGGEDISDGVVSWGNHEADVKEIEVTGLSAGRTAKLTMSSPQGGLNVIAASNNLSVVAVAANAPYFYQAPVVEEAISRYVTVSNIYPVSAESTQRLTFTKIDGSLPTGLSAKFDPDSFGMVIVGTPTAAAGTYTATFQVKQGNVAGLPIKLVYTISDPTASGGTEKKDGYNAAVAAVSSRTFKDIAAIALNNLLDESAANELAGLVTITIPRRGNVSARFNGETGTVSFSSAGWSSFGEDGDDALTATLKSNLKGWSMKVIANDDGSVEAEIVSPNSEAKIVASTSGKTSWSRTNPASKWVGSYTVALINDSARIEESVENMAPRGNGYLTLKMTSSSANTGTFSWAGMLPNGTGVSGSAVVNGDDDCEGMLPIFKRTSTDVISAVLSIPECTTVTSVNDLAAYWKHTEKYAETTFKCGFDAYGGIYNSQTNFAEQAIAGYNTSNLTFKVDLSGLAGELFNYGTVAESIANVTLTVGKSSMSLAKNSIGASFSFTRGTGVVSGRVSIPYTTDAGAERKITANFKGVVIIGYGPGCGCGDEGSPELELPFITGAYFLSDKASVKKGTKTTTATAKRGGVFKVE